MPLSVKLVTPSRMVVAREDADFVFANGASGDVGILPGHAPFLASLCVGEVRIESAGRSERFAVSGGFLEAGPESVTILAETAEGHGDIDVERAREAQKRAEKRLEAEVDDIDVARAEAALVRSMNRIHIAQRGG